MIVILVSPNSNKLQFSKKKKNSVILSVVNAHTFFVEKYHQ